MRFAKLFLSFADLPEETAFRRSYTMYDQDQWLLVDPDLAGTVEDVLTEHADIYEDNDLDDFVNRMCLGDARMFLPGLNLAYTDRSSMAASTEVRVPYVDVEVVKAAFAVPGDRKIVGRQGKAVLKEAATSVLPLGEIGVPAEGPVQRPAARLDEPGSGTAGARGGQRRRAGQFRAPAPRRPGAHGRRGRRRERTSPSICGMC